MDSRDTSIRRVRLEEIILLYEDELRRFFTKHLHNAADVDDCLQETFLKMWKSVPQSELRDDIRGYVFTVALNVMRDRRRRDLVRNRDLHEEVSDSLEAVRTGEIEDQLYWNEALRLLEGELKNLRPSTRKIFLMYHLENKTYVDIANEFGISVRTVEREVARALQHMSAAIGNLIF